MSATPMRSVKLSAEDWEALADLARAHGWRSRNEAIRQLIAGAVRFLDPMPTPDQTAELTRRLRVVDLT